MKELKWQRIDEEWSIKINENLYIVLSKRFGTWSVWSCHGTDNVKLADCIDKLKDAKEKGMKIAQAIVE